MCVYQKRHDAPPFLPVGDEAMGTMFLIPGRFAESPAGGLSRRGTMFIPVHRALGVTCPIPPTRAYMVRGPTSGRPPHLPTAPHPFGVCARRSAGVGCMYVIIPFRDPIPATPEWPWP